MRTHPSSRPEGAPASAAGALAAFTRDDPRFWDARDPAEYGADGLYRHGPHEARPALVHLIKRPPFAPSAPAPAVARAQQEIKRKRALAVIESRKRHARLARAVGGAFTRSRRRQAA